MQRGMEMTTLRRTGGATAPPCVSRKGEQYIVPLQIVRPIIGAPGADPTGAANSEIGHHNTATQVDAIHWFLVIVRAVCRINAKRTCENQKTDSP